MRCLREKAGLAMEEELRRRQTWEEKTLGYFVVVIYSLPRIAIEPVAVAVVVAVAAAVAVDMVVDMVAVAVEQDILHHNYQAV